MISVIESYSAIVASYDVQRYRQYGDAHEFVAVIHFIDGSSLHIRDYVFADGERKYSFHWQDSTQRLICRWDNSEHHKHTQAEIQESAPMTIQKILEHISERIKPKLE